MAESEQENHGVVIVGLPTNDSKIRDFGDEEKHITLIWLGKDDEQTVDLQAVHDAVTQIAGQYGPVTGLVESTGQLGDDGAQVAFVRGDGLWDLHDQLLSDPTIKQQHDAVEQFPKWTPHTTLDYEKSFDADELPDEITYDRLAVWHGDDRMEVPLGPQSDDPADADDLDDLDDEDWDDFSIIAAAHTPITASLDPDENIVRISMPVPVKNAASLSYGDTPTRMEIPLLELGSTSEFDPDRIEQLLTLVRDVATGTRYNLAATFPSEFGQDGEGRLFARADVSELSGLKTRLLSSLLRNGFRPSSSLPENVITFASPTYLAAPPELFQTKPQRAFFDRLTVTIGDREIQFPFGVISSGAPADAVTSSGEFSFDDDGIANFAVEMQVPAEVADPQLEGEGRGFRIPMLLPEGRPTGDGRIFDPFSLTTRDLPLPLLWQIKTDTAHDGSVVVGRIDSIERVSGGLGNAIGVFDIGPYGREAQRLVEKKFLRGVSADLDMFEAVSEEEVDPEQDEAPVEFGDGDGPQIRSRKISSPLVRISSGRVMGGTLVAKPAFQECTIELLDVAPEQEETLVADGIYIDRPDEALTACALVASAIPVAPPGAWFANPQLKTPTPLQVEDDGRVFGHIAAWHVNHIGLPFGTKPPRSRSGYAYFHTGVCRTAESKDIPVGQLTLAGGHASLSANAAAAVKHYDDTGSAVADVHAGEDAFGIWVAGALRPGSTPEQIRTLRASAPSGDWRPVGGQLELVAVCQVNVPGFPITRVMVASGYVTALVAAGAQVLAELKAPTVDSRLASLENQTTLAASAQQARQRINRVREASALNASGAAHKQGDWVQWNSSGGTAHGKIAKVETSGTVSRGEGSQDQQASADDPVFVITVYNQDGDTWAKTDTEVRHHGGALRAWSPPTSLTAAALRERLSITAAAIDAEVTSFRQYSKGTREDYARKGWALADGSFPIRDVGDLRRAIRAFGRTSKDKKTAVRKHIMKRARGLSRADLIPEQWTQAAALRASVELRRTEPNWDAVDEGLHCLVAALKFRGREDFEEELHPRDDSGRFTHVIARLKEKLEGQVGTQEAVEHLDKAQSAVDEGDNETAKREAGQVIHLVDQLADDTAINSLKDDLRNGSRDLAEVLAYLPLPQGDADQKFRFTDLPQSLQGLVNDLVERVKVKLTPEEFNEAVGPVESYLGGGDVMAIDELHSWMAKMLQYLI